MKKSKVIFLALLACAFGVSARTVTPTEARGAARAWVCRGKTLGARFPSDVAESAVMHTTTNGATFYSVKMANGGTVFMAGDTSIEPVICFTSDVSDFSTIDKKSPLWALLNWDVSIRQSAGRPLLALATMEAAARQTALDVNERNWTALINEGEELMARPKLFLAAAALRFEPGDLRVDKLVKSTWDQGDAGGGYHLSDDSTCYNYYTPQDATGTIVEGSRENAICGCVATAMAQIMYTYRFPDSAVPGVYDSCWYDKTEIDLSVSGESYAWDTMEASPKADASEDVRKAIGLLTSDAGRSVGMHYTRDDSGSFTFKARKALTDVFKYPNAVYIDNDDVSVTGSSAMGKIMFANFDAGYPVMLGISGAGGHEIVGDGYGFQDGVPYVHLNMGWSGQDDLWYNLPDIGLFSSVDDVVYNIFPDKSGCAIIAGRVTNDDGDGFAGVEVEISNGDDVITTTTSESGVWFSLVENGSYTVSFRDPVHGWQDALERPVEVAAPVETTKNFRWVTPLYDQASQSGGTEEGDFPAVRDVSSIGNSWGNDIVLSEPTVRIVVGTETNLYTSLDKALEAAQAGDTVEILKQTALKNPSKVAVDCAIVATNEDATASAIVRYGGAQIEVADNVTVSVSNVAFDGVTDETTIVVSTGGVLRVGGYCSLGSVWTATSNNLVVVSELTYPFTVISKDAANAGQSFALGADGLDYLTASNCANRMLHYANTRLGGEAFVNAAGKIAFRWSDNALVPDEAAVAKLIVDGRVRNYRSVDDILEDIDGTTGTNEIAVVRDGSFERYYDIKAGSALFLHGLGDVRPTLIPGGDSGFNVGTDGSLMISNLVLKGFRDASKANEIGFITVSGGDFTLEAGAELNDMEGRVSARGSGVVDLRLGMVTMRPKSAIVNCASQEGANGGGFGGAIYAHYDNACTLNLEGGTISNCFAAVNGGGVYVDEFYGRSPVVSLSGGMVICDNASKSGGAKDDLCVCTPRALPNFRLKGNLFGKVGIRYETIAFGYSSGNKVGEPFIMNDVATVAPATFLSFFSDVNASLMAVTNATGDKLVWKTRPADDGQCAPGDAVALQIDADGNTNYYASVARAFEYMGSNSAYVVEMLAPDWLEESVVIPSGCDVLLRMAEGLPAEMFPLMRDGDCGISVPAGTSLALTNVCISGYGDDLAYALWQYGVDSVRSKPFLNVAGGSLQLSDGAVVCDVFGFSSRAASAITVSAGGRFEMLDGAIIERCANAYFDVDHVASPGVGGGILVDGWKDKDEKSVAYLRGGTIRDCLASRGSAVYVCNKADVYVSGAVRVEIDEPYHYNDFVVEDGSRLYLEDAVTGVFNMSDGTDGPAHDANFIGCVTWDWAGDVIALTNSAAKFIHSVSSDVGTAVTNLIDKADTILVWSGAVSGGQLYTNLEGKVYAPVSDVVVVPSVFMPLPALPSTADEDAVVAALENSGLTDPLVVENITTLADYNSFREWANDMGVDDVTESPHAYRSYQFGTDALLENEPTVEIAEVSNADGALTVSIVVKDGEDRVKVAAESVAKLFAATSDVSDWTKKIDLTVDGDAVQNADNSLTFKMTPVGAPSAVFIRLQY